MIPILLAVASALVWMPKWWRVAQREHYLPGSVNSTLFRWLETTPVPNMGLVLGGAGWYGRHNPDNGLRADLANRFQLL